MSFSKETKKTLIKLEEKSDAERREKLAGVLRGAGSLGISHAGVSFSVSTESYDLIKKVARLIRSLYSLEPELRAESVKLNNTELYTMSVEPPESETILFDLRLLSRDTDGNKTLVNDFASTVADAESAKHFITGMFLGCGSVMLPAAGRGGYHLEFVTAHESAAEELSHLLAEFDFIPKKVARKSSFVVYLKESEAICDFFAFLGASKVVLELQEVMTERNLRNTLNRQANCQASNIDKTVVASVRQVEAIELIETTIGLHGLSPQLAELAILRLENPTDSLDELVLKLNGSVTKSGINHRFRKILKIANDLGGKEV